MERFSTGRAARQDRGTRNLETHAVPTHNGRGGRGRGLRPDAGVAGLALPHDGVVRLGAPPKKAVVGLGVHVGADIKNLGRGWKIGVGRDLVENLLADNF